MSQTATFSRDTVAEPTVAGRARARRRLRVLLMGGGLLAVAVGSGAYWLHGGQWLSSDDAYLNRDKVAL